ncbi:S1C family serine protease [Saccharomonospora sp. CUA-673]|uniref:S1C family serine protease n=1 Tax=Saccharomonospora sp. CUA-673 TaxID=1904969 RepID=UPI000A5E7684
MSENDPTFGRYSDTPAPSMPAQDGSGREQGATGSAGDAAPNPWSVEGAAQGQQAQGQQAQGQQAQNPQPAQHQQAQGSETGQAPQAGQNPYAPYAAYPGQPAQQGFGGADQGTNPGTTPGSNPYAPPGQSPYPGGYGTLGGQTGSMPPVQDGSRSSGGGRSGNTKLIVGVAVLALLFGGAAGMVGGSLTAGDSATGPTVNSLDQERPARQTGNAENGSIEAVAQDVSPSVVQLKTVSGEGAGEGSGFIISDDGHILTNNHVIAGAAGGGGQIQVVFNDGQTTNASVVGRDPTTDVAVVKAERASNLPAVELGRSDDLRVGQQVVAIGSPYELAGTVTSGIVSSLQRPVSAGGGGDQTTVMDAIQTDAAINPGNSGGPLVNMRGQIIGINSAIYSPSSGMSQQEAGNVGIGFAIPIDQARRTADDIIKDGHATQTFIGATVGNSRQGGAAIADVEPGSPAEEAGLKGGDVVVRIGERNVEDSDTLVAAIRTRRRVSRSR